MCCDDDYCKAARNIAIARTFRHLNPWDARNHDPPQKVSDYILELVSDDTDSRIPELAN